MTQLNPKSPCLHRKQGWRNGEEIRSSFSRRLRRESGEVLLKSRTRNEWKRDASGLSFPLSLNFV